MRRNYNRKFDIAMPGQPDGVFGGHARSKPYRNSSGGVKEQWSVTVPAPATNTVYKLRVNGGTAIVRTDDPAPTQEEFTQEFVQAIRTNALILSYSAMSVSGNTITLTAKEPGDTLSVVGTAVTATKTLNAVKPVDVPFGRFVGRSVSETDSLNARLVNDTDDIILGVSMNPKDVESIGIAEQRRTAFYATDTMDICADTVGWNGIWVECVEDDIKITDIPYISLSPNFEGAITKTSAGAIPLTVQRARIEENAQILSSGVCVVLLSFNCTYHT